MMQRSTGKLGARLGKTTGWIHRTSLKNKNVRMLSEVEYLKIDDHGIHIQVGGKPEVIDVDNVVVCAGQLSNRDLMEALERADAEVHLIGGADVASELDAKRAIDQGSRLATKL
jgi:2,4-dienoyl-CoA reductase (NADPH2)